MILLTGAAGFIGSHIRRALINFYGGDKVLCLTSKPIPNCRFFLHHDYAFSAAEFASFSEQIEYIIHAGAFIPKSGTESNDWRKSYSNIQSTMTLLMGNYPKLKAIIFLSTVDVYGAAPIITESNPIVPVSLYGHSKYFCEELITRWSLERGVLSHILRVGHVYGPGEEAYHKLIPTSFARLAKGENLQMWGDGEEIRSFIFVNDVVHAIMNALNLGDSIGHVNLVGGQKISIRELLQKLISISGRKTQIEQRTQNSSPRNLIFDNAKLVRTLLPSETKFEDGLLEEWRYMSSLYI